jgi:hypothetical protein
LLSPSTVFIRNQTLGGIPVENRKGVGIAMIVYTFEVGGFSAWSSRRFGFFLSFFSSLFLPHIDSGRSVTVACFGTALERVQPLSGVALDETWLPFVRALDVLLLTKDGEYAPPSMLTQLRN